MDRKVVRELVKRAILSAAVLALFSKPVTLPMGRHHQGGSIPEGQFDYYVLALSWAPNYCAGHANQYASECATGQHANFVLHGLWPQSSAGDSPLRCAPVRPVSRPIMRHMIEYYPSRGLVQHEWRQHGACTGLSAAEYFDEVEQAFNTVKIPEQYRNLDQNETVSVTEIEQAFARVNSAPSEAFRVTCHAGEMVNVEACLTKNLHFQPCTANVRECRSQRVMMRQVQ